MHTGEQCPYLALAHIASQTRGVALYRGIDILIFTPSPRKGQARAETHKSAMTLIHALPRLDSITRFSTIRTPLETHPYGITPDIFPHQAETLRGRKNPLPEVTLQLPQQVRIVRIAQARADLKVDGVLSSAQLQRYYRLKPANLTGELFTVAQMRPIGGRYALEVQQILVVSGAAMARREDAELNHRLTLAEMRLSLGIPADPGCWQVDPRNILKFN